MPWKETLASTCERWVARFSRGRISSITSRSATRLGCPPKVGRFTYVGGCTPVAQHSLTFAFSIATAFAAERANRLTVADHPTRYSGRALAGSQASRSRARAPADRIGCRDCNRSRVGMARRWHIRRVVRVSSNWSVAQQRLRLLKGIPHQITAS